MRIIIPLIFISFLGCNFFSSSPSKSEAAAAVRQYLLSSKSQDCEGDVEIETLKVIEIKEFSKKLGGWPIIADFRVVCNSEGISSTWKSSSTQKVTTCIASKVGGKLVCGLPVEFQAAQKEMEEQMEKALGNIKFN